MVKRIIFVILILLLQIKIIGQNEADLIVVVETPPVFDGDLEDFINKNIEYPLSAIQDSIEGVVFVSFYIDTLGYTFNHHIQKGVRSDLNEEALRITKLVKFVSAAKQRGKSITVNYIVPVKFSLNNEQYSIITDSKCKLPLFKESYTGIYEIDIDSDQVDCELRISPDLSYEIWLSYQATDDIVNVAVLSYGHYSSSDGQMILHDDYYNYDWVVSIKENVINVTCGYAFLNGKAVLNHHDEIVKITPPDNVYLGKIKTQVDRFIAQQDNPQMIVGQYEDQNHNNVLKINSDGKYQLYLKDVLLSEGDWSQQDNLLILHDVHLNHDFSVAIGNRSLLSLGVPGDFGGTPFALIKTNNSTQETKTPPRNRRGG